MRVRIEQELALLRHYYGDVVHSEHGGEDWFLISRYPFPPGWTLEGAPVEFAPVAFKVGSAHPTSAPYGFAVATAMRFKGAAPANSASCSPPFPGAWMLFSWQPADGEWRPTDDLHSGSNLYVWARGFAHRLAEGV